MKSIVLQEILKKKYFLGRHVCTYYGSYNYTKMSVDSGFQDEGCVGYEETHTCWDILFETKEFVRELMIGDLIHVDGKDFQIIKTAHDGDGKILYYIDKKEINEDLDSKKKAEDDLETRKLILIERNRKLDIGLVNVCCDDVKKATKKWYQFWL